MTSLAHQDDVQAAAAGDDEALRRLVQLYHERVHRFGQRVCRDGFDADDAVQEAFVKLARRPDVVRDPGVVGWLLTTVKNACLRLARSLLRPGRRLGERLDTEPEQLAATTPTPEEALARWQLVEQVHRALASLDPEQREVLVLRDLEGLSGEAVARQLGLSEAAMKSRLHRARLRVRALLEAENDRAGGDERRVRQ